MQPLSVLGPLPDALKRGVLGAVRVEISALRLDDSLNGFWLGPDGGPYWTLVGGDDLSVILNHVSPKTPLGKALLKIGLILHPTGSQKSECAADAEHFCCVSLSAPNGNIVLFISPCRME